VEHGRDARATDTRLGHLIQPNRAKVIPDGNHHARVDAGEPGNDLQKF